MLNELLDIGKAVSQIGKPPQPPKKDANHHFNPMQFASALGDMGGGAAAAEGAGAAGGIAELAPLLLL